MKPFKLNRIRQTAGGALLMTLVMSGIALLVLTGAMTWSTTNTKLNDRSNSYGRDVAAGEAAVEKALTRMNKDFFDGGGWAVAQNMNTYRGIVPTSADSAFWATWEFNNASGQTGQTYVQNGMLTNYMVLSGPFAGLRG